MDTPTPEPHPAVSVVMPVLNEEATIDAAMESITNQDYAGPVEILVVDGGSQDATLQRLSAWAERMPNLRILDNPMRVQSIGCNTAIAQARTDYIVRMDAHSSYAPDYITRSMATLLESGATAAGGPMVATDDHPFGRAVAAAMDSKLMAGPAAYRHATARRFCDTVYLGTFRRADFEAVGGYRSFPSNVAEDADFYHRLRTAHGGTVMVDPAIRSWYAPRRTVRGLWRQYFRYGQAKAEMIWANRKLPSLRPLGPAVFVVLLAIATIIALLGNILPLVVLASVWIAIIGAVAVFAPASTRRVIGAAAVMHVSYGLGMWMGLLRGPSAVRALLEASR